MKQVVSLRLDAEELAKVKALAKELKMKDSEAIREMIKSYGDTPKIKPGDVLGREWFAKPHFVDRHNRRDYYVFYEDFVVATRIREMKLMVFEEHPREVWIRAVNNSEFYARSYRILKYEAGQVIKDSWMAE